MEDFRFLLTCNYRVKDFENMPLFYKDILLYFHELKTLYGCDVGEFVSMVKTFFWKEWFMKGIKRIVYALKKTSFLHYFQVISAIPGHLLTKAKSKDSTSESVSHEDPESFRLAENVNINLLLLANYSSWI